MSSSGLTSMLRSLAFSSLAIATLALTPGLAGATSPGAAAPPASSAPAASSSGAQAAAPSSSSSARPASDSDPAQALFDRGVAEMEAGHPEKGCPAIEASQRLDPRPGTLFTLAECEAQRGRVATSMRYYAEYLALYRTFNDRKKLEQKDRAAISEDQLRKLDLLAPRLTLTLPPDAGSDVVVKRDGDVVAELSLGTAVVVDPGEHVITTSVPGGPTTEHRLSLGPGDARSLVLTVRRDGGAGPESPDKPPPGPGLTGAPAVRPPPPDPRPYRIGALSAGSAAVIGLVVGVVTGILAIEQSRIVNRNCDTSSPVYVCNDAGLAAKNQLYPLGTASTIGFIAGGVGISVGFTLLLVAPSAPAPPTPALTVGKWPPSGGAALEVGPMGLRVGGSF